MITDRFSSDYPISCAQGRHGELLIVQGRGVRPAKWTGSGEAVSAGLDAPVTPPTITVDPTSHYYVARVDVNKPGAVYSSPPALTFSSDPPVDLVRGRPAKAASYLSQSSVSEIRVLDGGKYYPAPPGIELQDSHGKGAVLQATVVNPDFAVGEPYNDPKTGLTQWTIVERPPLDSTARFPALAGAPWDISTNVNGTWTEYNLGYWIYANGPTGTTTNRRSFTRQGYTGTGIGAAVRLRWEGSIKRSTLTYDGATRLVSVEPLRYGRYYDDTATYLIIINSIAGPSARYVIAGTTAGNPANTSAPAYSISSVSVVAPGSGYLVAPQLKFKSNSGFGAYATCSVREGQIESVTLENGGGGYRTAPEIEVLSGGAEAFAVARPHLRGIYQCYYRYVDDTPESRGGPLPSNLSPVQEVDVGEAATSLTWDVSAAQAQPSAVLLAESGDALLPDGPADGGGVSRLTTDSPIRSLKWELWRTTSNQATTLYRVATITGTNYLDDLTDEELRNPDRDGYAAMPIVLPNGELNANRFTPPPADKAVVVRFQDRHWYGVDTSGLQPNTILYSEVDEPESVPEINEIVLQQNARDADALTAMIPFGPTLLLMQSRHAYSLTFAKQPVIDAQVSPIAYRGALNQRSWDIYAGLCYVLDQYGVYAIGPTGDVQSLSDPIDNLFRDSIDFNKSTWAFLLIDASTKTLRAFVSFKADDSIGFPTRALCYSIETKAWWIETYPQRIHGGTQVQLSNGDYRCAYGATGGVYLLNEGAADAARGSVVSVSVTSRGSGYRKPPTVQATGGTGAQFQAVINGEGEVVSIWILSPGHGYESGQLFISPPDDPSSQGVRAAASFVATPLNADTPLFPTYRYKGGCVEYSTDSEDPGAASTQPRNIRLLYKPQSERCELSLRTYYNNSPHPRRNLVSRQRGVGFSFDAVDSGARLDMAANENRYGADSGVASAMLAGRTLDDIASSDRHVAVELVGAATTDERVVFYQLDVMGSAAK